MQLIETVTVAQIAANSLAAVRVFEKYGIDYCCGGKRPLADVCRDKGYNPEVIQAELDGAAAGNQERERDWTTAPLSDLIEYIVGRHHDYLRGEFPGLQSRLDKVYRVYNQRYGPALLGLPEVFGALRSELESHIRKEEVILFPAIVAFEEVVRSGRQPNLPLTGLSELIRTMESEHSIAGDALTKIREITANFALPEYACVTYRALMSGLEELEHDLHLHIHLENNILFPRAERLETA